MGLTLYIREPLAVIPFPASTGSIAAKSAKPTSDTVAREKVGTVKPDFMAVSCILPADWLSISAERHRRPPLEDHDDFRQNGTSIGTRRR
jgi:hypothetical protein